MPNLPGLRYFCNECGTEVTEYDIADRADGIEDSSDYAICSACRSHIFTTPPVTAFNLYLSERFL